MKKILTILSISVLFFACGKLEDLNKNIKDPASVPGESLFTTAQHRVFNQMINTNVNNNIFRLFAQYWTETTYTDEVNYDLTSRTIPDNHWDIIYRDILKNFDEASKVINITPPPPEGENPAIKKNKLAIIEIMTVYCYSVLVETFGNVPYSEAMDINKPLPKYDDGLTVYKDLLSRLTAAIGNLDPAYGSLGTADNMYGGDVALWSKFANSLKLRMGLLLSDVDNATAKAAVESAAPNVFASNDDNAKLVYLGFVPNTNPLYIDLVASGRNDFVAANTFVDTLNALNDPRLPLYITQADTSTESGIIKLAYIGGIYGASNNFLSFSHIANPIQKPTFPGTLFDYSEVEFLLAEAAERGFTITGSAETHYNNAITASIADWGGSAADAAIYLANPKVTYTTAFPGDWKHTIGIQSWIALYNRGYEAWTMWRKLDYPQLQPGVDALTPIPVRYFYPIKEQTLNGKNYKAASAAIGGDVVTTRLFWDKY